MQHSERMQCHCGCDEFSIWRSMDKKQVITMLCQYCGCRRGISSPGVAVKQYAMSPMLVQFEEGHDPRLEHFWPGMRRMCVEGLASAILVEGGGVLGMGVEATREVGTGWRGKP